MKVILKKNVIQLSNMMKNFVFYYFLFVCIFRSNKKLSKIPINVINDHGHIPDPKIKNKTNIKLPKILIPKYYGNLSLCLEFYNLKMLFVIILN